MSFTREINETIADTRVVASTVSASSKHPLLRRLSFDVCLILEAEKSYMYDVISFILSARRSMLVAVIPSDNVKNDFYRAPKHVRHELILNSIERADVARCSFFDLQHVEEIA